MSVTRTLAQLAADLRIGDGVTEPTGAVAVVLGRIAATARTMVEQYAPAAPDSIHNEAFVRVVGWLYDSDPTGVSPGGGLSPCVHRARRPSCRRTRSGAGD